MKDKIYSWLAEKLPKRLVYWAYIRVGVHATTGDHSKTVVPELGMMDALKRWDTA